MFFSLVEKECRMWLKSILFYAYVVILVLFYITQMDSEVVSEPSPGQGEYGVCYTADPDVIMKNTLDTLISEFSSGSFATYPIGFYKEVILDQDTMDRISEIITNLTGVEEEQWMEQSDISVKKNLSFGEFKKEMKKVAEFVGKGSHYSEENLKLVRTEMTYRQAQEEYEDICEKDHITGAYARLFCDYTGIVLGILPAFLGIARVLRDKKNYVLQVLYTKPVSAVKMLAARYLAMVIVLFVPVLMLSCLGLAQAVYVAKVAQVTPDYLAFVRYSLLWLLPIILFVTAVSYAIAELTESLLSVFPCFVIWFAAIFAGGVNLRYVGWNMIPRFSTIGSTKLFESIYPQLIRNRIVYSVASLILLGVVGILYEQKRRGGVCCDRKVRKDSSDKPEI